MNKIIFYIILLIAFYLFLKVMGVLGYDEPQQQIEFYRYDYEGLHPIGYQGEYVGPAFTYEEATEIAKTI